MGKWSRIIPLVVVSLTALVYAGVDDETIFRDGFENPDPVITTLPVTIGRVDELYSYDVDATDTGGDILLYLLTTSPDGMSIDSTNGLIFWTPDTVGEFPVAVDVSNSGVGSAGQAWMITVEAAIDSDNDGLSDVREAVYRTDPNDPDSDDDGINDGDEVNTYNSDPLDADTDSDGLEDGEEANTHSTNPADPDSDDDKFADGTEIGAGTDPLNPNDFPEGPQDPLAIAPLVDPTTVTTLYDSSGFLWSGAPPIQTGVSEGTIDPIRAAVLQGIVMDEDGNALPGVDVSISGHPEFGQTISRVDGRFDMVVNGGSPLTVDYQKSGLLSAQRQVQVPWQQYSQVPDVVMIQVDTQVTLINLESAGMQMAQGSPVTDADGTRQATVLIPEGTTAELLMPDGSTQPITSLSIRATEYTVGDRGAEAMPAVLPPTSAYTYAVELSVDEAIAAGASRVSFNAPVAFYVDNFINIPVGEAVPVGYYDRDRATWVASQNGLVIEILGISGGLADIDVDGDGIADSGSALTELSFTDSERAQLAAEYSPGTTLWRALVSHFSPWDCNFPYKLAPDAIAPQVRGENGQDAPGPKDDQAKQPCTGKGSIIACQNQVLAERLKVFGTPYTLNYSSDRVPGRVISQTIGYQLTPDGDELPESLRRIDFQFYAAGQKVVDTSFAPTIGLDTEVSWNGRDAYGRPVTGAQNYGAVLTYVYEAVYAPAFPGSASFGLAAKEIDFEFERSRREIRLTSGTVGQFGFVDARAQGLGGWTLNVHHFYDPNSQTLYLGDGSRRSADEAAAFTIGDVSASKRDRPEYVGVDDIVFGPDGSLYGSDGWQIFRLEGDGGHTVIAGCDQRNSGCPSPVPENRGNGGPAIDAFLNRISGLAFGPDGSLYVGDNASGGRMVRKISPDGIIQTVAGRNDCCNHTDEVPATETDLGWVYDLTVGPDGTIYIADSEIFRIRAVTPDGIIHTIAGTGVEGSGGDGGPALEAQLLYVNSLALGPDGSLYLTTQDGSIESRLRRISADGIIETLAGGVSDQCAFCGDGGPATEARFRNLFGVDLAADGSIWLSDGNNDTIWRIGTDGIIHIVAGDGECVGASQLDLVVGEVAAHAPICSAGRVKIDPSGAVYWASDFEASTVLRLNQNFPAFSEDEIGIAAENGDLFYIFSSTGRHLRTINALTGATLLEFAYTAEGLLASITDAYGNLTRLERGGTGQPTTIIGPHGQRSALTIDAQGYLRSISNPASETYIFEYANGLLTRVTDPLSRSSSYAYDDGGRLTRAQDTAGGIQTLARTELPNGYEVVRTSTGGRTHTYRVEEMSDRSIVTTSTDPLGAVIEVVRNPLGETIMTWPNGEVVTSRQGPSERFTLQAPLAAEETFDAVSGMQTQVTRTQSVTLVDPADKFSISAQHDELEINGRVYTSTLDVASLTYSSTTPEGRAQVLKYDTLGRLIETRADPSLSQKKAIYNSSGLITQTTFGSQSVDFAYNAVGRVQSRTNTLGEQIRFEYDAANRYSALVLPSGRRYEYGYDALGNRTSVRMPSGAVHTLGYSLLGQETTYRPPGNLAALSSEYDTDRKYSATVYPSGRRVEYLKDANGRAIGISYPEGEISVTYVDATTDRAATMTSTPSGGSPQTLSFSYDGSIITGIGFSGTSNGAYSFRYNEDLFLEGLTLDGGPELAITSDDDGLLIGIGPYSITRDGPAGAPSHISDGSLSVDYSFDNEAKLVRRTHTAVEVAYDVQYSHDSTGRIIQLTESVDGVSTVYDYEYDLDGRLTEVNEDSVLVEEYTYDLNGNRTLRAVRGGSESSIYDSQDRINSHAGVAYTVDQDGFLAQRGTTTFEYSARGELLRVEIPGVDTITYAYDGFNRMVARTDSNGTVQYLYGDPNNPVIVTEVRDAGGVLTSYIYDSAGILYAMHRGTSRYYIGSNHVGTPRVVFDASGTAIKIIDYDAWGVLLNDSNPGFELHIGYAGGIVNPDIGMLRFGFRDYDPLTGRWTARDPLLYQAGQANLYAYVNNDPINYRDPTGLICLGGNFYRKFGGGATLCFDKQGTSLCLEVGFGQGGGSTFDLDGNIADVDNGGASYLEAKLGVKCGPISFGGSAKLDSCGKISLGCGAGLPGGFGGDPCAGSELIYNDGFNISGPTKAGVNGSLKSPGLANVINDLPNHTPPPERPPVGTRKADPQCKAEASLKGGVCGRHKW